MERIEEMTQGWYGRLDDLVTDLKDAGFEVEDANMEYVTAWGESEGDKDVFYTLWLEGTTTTFVVKTIKKELI